MPFYPLILLDEAYIDVCASWGYYNDGKLDYTTF